MLFDVLIVGGGVVGCAIAREFSRYALKVCLLENEADVSCGTSGANSGVVHSGLKEPSGTLKALYCVEGNALFPALCEELNVLFRRCGTLVVAVSEGEVEGLEGEFAQAEKNGVVGVRRLSRQEVSAMEPNVSAMEGVFAPTGGIVSPYELTIALAENAFENGVKMGLNAEVTGITRKNGLFKVSSSRGSYSARIVVNSAGVSARKVARMVGIERKTYECRGEYCILDKRVSGVISRMVYPVPPKRVGGFGVHLTPTIHGNLLIGPSDEYVEDGSNLATTRGKLRELLDGAKRLVPSLDVKSAIHEYAGMRAKIVAEGSKKRGDFKIEDIDGFINLLGIESPGLTAAPRIAQHVRELVEGQIELKAKESFNPKRKGITRFDALSLKEKSAFVKENPNYGEIVCRCENVTRQEVIDALNNPLGVKTLKGVKYRVRSLMGRCQGGYCLPKIVDIMREEGIEPKDITLKGEGSGLFIGDTKCLLK